MEKLREKKPRRRSSLNMSAGVSCGKGRGWLRSPPSFLPAVLRSKGLLMTFALVSFSKFLHGTEKERYSIHDCTEIIFCEWGFVDFCFESADEYKLGFFTCPSIFLFFSKDSWKPQRNMSKSRYCKIHIVLVILTHSNLRIRSSFSFTSFI